MFDEISIKVSDLEEMLKTLKEDDVKIVTISYLEGEEIDDDEFMPASLHFEHKVNEFESIDYEDIEETPLNF